MCNLISQSIPCESSEVSSRWKGEAIDVECIRKKSGVEHLFHYLPRDDSLSLRSVSPPLGPVSGLFDKGGSTFL
jgi:hypothetical protein